MIHESSYWKEPLLAAADLLSAIRINEDEPDDDLARVEREVLIGFYSIRKLLDTFKVSGSTKTMSFGLRYFEIESGSRVDYFNRWEIDELFDLERPLSETRDLTFLCNQFVHSYVHLFEIGESQAVEGVFVASDRARNDRLYFVSREQIVRIFRAVGSDYPSRQHYQRDAKTGQWEVRDA
jgi:hypothetical protein